MEPQVFFQSLRAGKIAPVYLFQGEESFLRMQALAALREFWVSSSFGYEVIEGKALTLREILDLAETSSFGDKKLLIVTEEAWLNEKLPLSAAEEEMLKAYLSNPNPLTCLVFLAKGSTGQKRMSQILAQGATLVDFHPLQGKALRSWLQEEMRKKGKNFTPAALDYLLMGEEKSLFFLSQEVEKIALFTGTAHKVTLADVQKVSGETSRVNIFNFLDAVGERKSEQALFFLKTLLDHQEPPLLILHLLARHFRLLYQAKLYPPPRGKEAAPPLPVPPFLARKLTRQANNFTFLELEAALSRLLALDLALKKSTPFPLFAFEDFLWSLEKEEGN